jgi:hypothetical protein
MAVAVAVVGQQAGEMVELEVPVVEVKVVHQQVLELLILAVAAAALLITEQGALAAPA